MKPKHTINAADAREMLARIKQADGDASRAAGQINSELRAIEPYTCRYLSRIQAALRTVAKDPARHIATLERFATYDQPIPDKTAEMHERRTAERTAMYHRHNHSRRADRFSNYRQITAKFNSNGTCGHAIEAGHTIGYHPELKKTQCRDCWQKWANENAEADRIEQYGI